MVNVVRGRPLAAMQANAPEAAALLKNLANESRLQILCVLLEGELSVGQLNERIPLSQSALSQHLGRLRRDGLVVTRRSAQSIYYTIGSDSALRVIEVLHGIFCGDDTGPRDEGSDQPGGSDD